MNTSIFDYKDATHWVQLALHAIPLIISIPVIFRHYQWRRDAKHTNTNQLEEISKLTFTALQILLFISVYLSMDTFVSLHTINNSALKTKENTENILVRMQTASTNKTRVVKGIDAVYQEIANVFEKRKDTKTLLTVDIVAYTLFTIEPRLEIWKSNGYLHDLELNIFHMDKDFIKTSSDIDAEWANKVIINSNLINSFLQDNQSLLKENNVKVNIYSYHHIPGVHGVRIRNEKSVISFSIWNLDNGHIKMPNEEGWLVIDKDDSSDVAALVNYQFDNWIKQCEKR